MILPHTQQARPALRPIDVIIFVRGQPHLVRCKVGIPVESQPAEG